MVGFPNKENSIQSMQCLNEMHYKLNPLCHVPYLIRFLKQFQKKKFSMCSLIQMCTLMYTTLLSYVGHQNRLYNTLPIRMNVLFTLRHYACVFTKSQKKQKYP